MKNLLIISLVFLSGCRSLTLVESGNHAFAGINFDYKISDSSYGDKVLLIAPPRTFDKSSVADITSGDKVVDKLSFASRRIMDKTCGKQNYKVKSTHFPQETPGALAITIGVLTGFIPMPGSDGTKEITFNCLFGNENAQK